MTKHRSKSKNATPTKAAVTKLPTSREVYHRILWDSRFASESFCIGVEERFSGMIEIPFAAFVPDGEIPWHRVWYFKQGQQTVWDREKRIDLIDDIAQRAMLPQITTTPIDSPCPTQANTATTQANAAIAQVHSSTQPNAAIMQEHLSLVAGWNQPVYRFDAHEGSWCPVRMGQSALHSPSSARLPEISKTVRMLTWNVLFDFYDAERIYSQERWAALIEFLVQQDVDILGLQEITDPFLTMLLAHPKIQQTFWVSEIPGGPTIQPYGQVILSRYPFRCAALSFSVKKQAMLADIRRGAERLGLAVVHLSSNRESDATQRRVQQVQELLASLSLSPCAGISDWIILGDFNSREGEPIEDMLSSHQLQDAWLFLQPETLGDTFVPANNTLALINSRSGQSGRLDRVYIRASKQLQPVEIEMVGQHPYTTSPEPRFFSDHVGILCSIVPQPVLAVLREICDALVREHSEEAVAFSALVPYGSFALGATTPDSDVDLVWVVPEDLNPGQLVSALIEQLTARNMLKYWSRRERAAHPVLSLAMESMDVEIAFLRLPWAYLPFSLTQPIPKELQSSEVATVWKGLQDTQAMLDEMQQYGLEAIFPDVLKIVKQWATRRRISGKAYGYLGGIDWSILTAYSCRETLRAALSQGRAIPATVEHFLADFFLRYAAWDGMEPIALQEPVPTIQRHPKRDIAMILSPGRDLVKNVAHTLLPSTWAVTRRELQRAADLLQKQGLQTQTWEILLQSVDIPASPDAIHLIVAGSTEAELMERIGQEKGVLLQNLIRWEQEDPQPCLRPYPPFAVRSQDNVWIANLVIAKASA